MGQSLGEAWLLDATNFPKESQSVIAWMNAMLAYISLHHQIKADLRHFVAKEPQPNCFNDFYTFHKLLSNRIMA